MRKIALILFIFLVGCGGIDKDGETAELQEYTIIDQYTDEAQRWAERESTCQKLVTACPGTGNLEFDLTYIMDQIKGFADFDKDPESVDYWESSCEVTADGGTDCDDFASLARRAIADSCVMEMYDDIDIAMRIVTLQTGVDHMVVIVYHGDHTFTVDNFFVIEQEIGLFVYEF